MKLLKKEGDNFLVMVSPSEDVSVGDYLLVSEQNRAIALQVFDERYLDVEGIEEELLREELIIEDTSGASHEYAPLSSIMTKINDMRILLCKPRLFIHKNRNTGYLSWLPSRSSSQVSKVDYETISSKSKNGTRKIEIGKVGGKEFHIYAESMDGRITLITGKKECGKSHLAKILLRGLTQYGAYCVVFDLNDEYSFLCREDDSSSRFIRLIPGKNLVFTLKSAGLRAVSSILAHSLDIPGTSLREFVKIWNYLEETGRLSLADFLDTVERWRCNEFVRDALFSRIHTLMNTGIFKDVSQNEDFKGYLKREGGCCIIISLSHVSPLTRRILVELILSKLSDLLERKEITPVFLFAEEAHLYLRETYWEDLITRMRHLGIFTVFITNQPDSIDRKIYRQIDNLFVYHLSNDTDINLISQSSSIDQESISSIVKGLPPRSCLVIGNVVANMPIVVDVIESDLKETGSTRLFFKQTVR
jgi:energy-coupling factor transporter ATP-binding protein EcfA2